MSLFFRQNRHLSIENRIVNQVGVGWKHGHVDNLKENLVYQNVTKSTNKNGRQPLQQEIDA